MTTTALAEKAVVGRRIIHDHAARKAKLPGIITGLNDGFGGGFFVRLDGDRSSFLVPTKFVWRVTFLDEVVPVPEIPTGPFTPTVDEMEGEWEGVLLCSIGEDGDVIALTDDHKKAVQAIAVYRREMAGCIYNPEFDGVDPDDVKAWWAVFEWEPEDAEMPWTVRWDDDLEGTDHAIRIHHLPA